MLKAAVLVALTGCWSGSAPAPESPAAPVAKVAGTVVPSVRMMTPAEWEACETCDEQSLEGGAPLRYKNLPAVSTDGTLIAVVEERDGWGHVPVPGIRLIDRTGATVKRLSVGGDRVAAEPLVAQANGELAEHTWLPLALPEMDQRELSDTESATEMFVGDFSVTYRRRNDGDVWLPPSVITVAAKGGAKIVERTDTETAWHNPPSCNLPSFGPVGANATARVVLFTTGLGMGGHNCDGVEQLPSWHVLAF